MLTLQELEKMFSDLGIDFSAPGFYNNRAFKDLEKQHPLFIEAYAEYIEASEYDHDYLECARVSVVELCRFMFDELVRDGREGACIDASGSLQQMLEREGLWAYHVAGGLKMGFPDGSGLRPRYFWPFVHPDNPALTGHSWLRVPPYQVVDITISVQPYSDREAQYLGDFIAAENFEGAEVEADDLFEPELVEHLTEKHGDPPTIHRLESAHLNFFERFGAFEISHRDVRLKYIPTHISAMDGTLEEITSLSLSGRYPIQLYEDYKKLRDSE